MADSFAALISSGLSQRHLLPRLCLHDLLSIEGISSTISRLLLSEDFWHSAILRSLPPGHSLTRGQVASGSRRAAHQHADTQKAIRDQDLTIKCAAGMTGILTYGQVCCQDWLNLCPALQS